jgi:hypothetical protein
VKSGVRSVCRNLECVGIGMFRALQKVSECRELRVESDILVSGRRCSRARGKVETRRGHRSALYERCLSICLPLPSSSICCLFTTDGIE